MFNDTRRFVAGDRVVLAAAKEGLPVGDSGVVMARGDKTRGYPDYSIDFVGTGRHADCVWCNENEIKRHPRKYFLRFISTNVRCMSDGHHWFTLQIDNAGKCLFGCRAFSIGRTRCQVTPYRRRTFLAGVTRSFVMPIKDSAFGTCP